MIKEQYFCWKKVEKNMKKTFILLFSKQKRTNKMEGTHILTRRSNKGQKVIL
ncbi:MAG TPA: hypothetical protein OIM45_07045 [Clostridiaceae bacterium]|nr:hypothetical protein [Clostridiaceae bacterium]